MYQEDSFKTSQVVYAHTRSDEADMEYKMHCHNSYEIYYMVKGNVEYFLEGTSWKKLGVYGRTVPGRMVF